MDVGTFQKRERTYLVFHYKNEPEDPFKYVYAHSLELDEYGIGKSWVIIQPPRA